MWDRIEVPGEFEVVRVRSALGDRQRAQSGIFTRLHSLEHLELEPYLRVQGACKLLNCVRSPDGCRRARYEGPPIDEHYSRTLFPDLHGAAWQANIDNTRIFSGHLFYERAKTPWGLGFDPTQQPDDE